MKKYFALLPLAGLLLVGCEDDEGPIIENRQIDQEPVTITSGSADFSTYVALGNSLTAGFSDNALFRMGQEASFPNMLAGNFALAGGGNFEIPFMADDLGGATLGGDPILGNRFILSFATGSPLPVPIDTQTFATEISQTLTGPFNNMGVPGAKSYHLLAPGYGNVAGLAVGTANPYFVRFASSPDATILGDAAAQNPSFFSLWIGNNDILGYVTAGGAGMDQTGNPDPSTYGGSDISDPNVVAGSIDAILQQMAAIGAEGVIANLPNVTSIPFLTTVPYNPVPLDQATADLLNGAYAAYNGGLQLAAAPVAAGGLGLITPEEAARRTIVFEAGDTNAAVIIDEDLTDLTFVNPALINMRQTTPEDLIVLPASTFIGTLANPMDPTSINGVAVPLADQWVLTPEEQAIANAALIAYNTVIEGLAVQYDLAFVDANALLVELLDSGITMPDGSVVTADFGTGGGFSLDGVHPSPRGYAILANAFVAAINQKYGSNLPGVNPLDFTGLYLN